MLRKKRSESQDPWEEKHGRKKDEGDPAIPARFDSFQGHPGRFAQVVQIKKDEKTLSAEKGDGDETEKWVWVHHRIHCVTDHESGSQVIAGEGVGLPGRVSVESISPSG
jgi:hypothetical protein